MQWSITTKEDQLLVEYDFRNDADQPIFMCRPSPPYVTVESTRDVRIWLGMYVIGPDEDVYRPIVPEVVRLEPGERYRGSFALRLPLDEIHPFPRYEYAKKKPATSKSVRLEIGVFPADERYPPPIVTKDGRERMVAPYGWASQTIRYIVGETKRVELPILCPETEEQ